MPSKTTTTLRRSKRKAAKKAKEKISKIFESKRSSHSNKKSKSSKSSRSWLSTEAPKPFTASSKPTPIPSTGRTWTRWDRPGFGQPRPSPEVWENMTDKQKRIWFNTHSFGKPRDITTSKRRLTGKGQTGKWEWSSGCGGDMDLDGDDDDDDDDDEEEETKEDEYAYRWKGKTTFVSAYPERYEPPKWQFASTHYRAYQNLVNQDISEIGQDPRGLHGNNRLVRNENVGVLYVEHHDGSIMTCTATVVDPQKHWLLTCAHVFINQKGILTEPLELQFIRDVNPTWWAPKWSEHDPDKLVGWHPPHSKRLSDSNERLWDKTAYHKMNLPKDYKTIRLYPQFRAAYESRLNVFECAAYDMALILLPEPMRNATTKINLVKLGNTLPKYMNIVGCPQMGLKDIYRRNPNVRRKLRLKKNQQMVQNCQWFLRAQEMYKSNGKIIPADFTHDGDWIQYTAYTKKGYSGAPVCIANECGQYYNSAVSLVAIHSGTGSGGYNKKNKHVIRESVGTLMTNEAIKWIRSCTEQKIPIYEYQSSDPAFHRDPRKNEMMRAVQMAETPRMRRILSKGMRQKLPADTMPLYTGSDYDDDEEDEEQKAAHL